MVMEMAVQNAAHAVIVEVKSEIDMEGITKTPAETKIETEPTDTAIIVAVHHETGIDVAQGPGRQVEIAGVMTSHGTEVDHHIGREKMETRLADEGIEHTFSLPKFKVHILKERLVCQKGTEFLTLLKTISLVRGHYTPNLKGIYLGP